MTIYTYKNKQPNIVFLQPLFRAFDALSIQCDLLFFVLLTTVKLPLLHLNGLDYGIRQNKNKRVLSFVFSHHIPSKTFGMALSK